MSNFTIILRKYAGSIISSLGFVLLAILTYGDLGELFTEQYWQNVGGNISSIGALSIGLVMIQVSIKQGISEQALSAGLNTQTTTEKFKEHKELLTRNRERYVYLPYFLSMRNNRETKMRKREFLCDNDFTNERALILSGNKRLINKYKAIKVNITADSIKWSTTDIIYQKNGRIEKLEGYRKRRLVKGLISGVVFMFATTLITGGMFLAPAEVSFLQKTIKLITYVFVIAITAVIDIGKNYEKGAFGVPNELDEVNNIWHEFEKWEIPEWVKEEVEKNAKSQEHMTMLDEDVKKLPAPTVVEIIEPLDRNKSVIEIKEDEEKEDYSSERENSINSGAGVQEKSGKSEII